MKKQWYIYGAILLALTISSCRTGYVNVSSNGDQEVIMESAGGSVGLNEFVDFRNKQVASFTYDTLQKAFSNAVASGNLAKADTLHSLIERFKYLNGCGYNYAVPSGQSVRLYVENNSPYIVTLTSQPFANISLLPGTRSQYPFLLPIGAFNVDYTLSNGRVTWKRHYTFPIEKGQTKPLTFEK
jgi:hypothetical protein